MSEFKEAGKAVWRKLLLLRRLVSLKKKNPYYYWDNRKGALRTRSQSTKAPTCRNGNLLERGVNWNWWCRWQLAAGGWGDPACTQWTEECFKISLPRYTEVSTELWGDQTTIPAVNQTWLSCPHYDEFADMWNSSITMSWRLTWKVQKATEARLAGQGLLHEVVQVKTNGNAGCASLCSVF